MKDIITDLSITESRHSAAEKWKEYVSAEKIYRRKEYTDMKKVYNQIKGGRKVIDIFKVIQRGGVRSNQHPVLAIAKITAKKIWCRYYPSGSVQYIHRDSRWGGGAGDINSHDVVLPACLPEFNKTLIPLRDTWRPDHFQLQAPVPPVPPKYMPKKITDDYYILWEVDEWKVIPPTDPWLLRRITNTLFVVVAGWDLTEIEKSVMHGRLI